MNNLWNYFGPIGVASLALWLAAAVLLAAFLPAKRRTAVYAAALLLAAAGLGLANWNSANINAIDIDRSAEALTAAALGEKAALDKFTKRAANIQFAEDTAQDAADIAGVSTAEEKGAYERAMEEQMSKTPAYRERGRQKREAGKRRSLDADDPDAASSVGMAEGDVPDRVDAADPNVRRLPEADVMRADRYDRWNLTGARWTLLAALALLVFDYLSRFNRTFGAMWPIPIGGRNVDKWFAKTRTVFVQGDASALPAALAPFLDGVVRKGESFIVFADADPLAGRDALHRWRVGPLRGGAVPKLVIDREGGRYDSDFAFESAWFGRACIVITGKPAAEAFLFDFISLLEHRQGTRASAAGTLNLVWARPEKIDPATLDELAYLCRETNGKLLIAASRPPEPAESQHIDEVFHAAADGRVVVAG